MPFRHILDPEQLALVTAVFDDICRTTGLEQDSPEREDVAVLAMHFYRHGYHSADGLRSVIDEAMREAIQLTSAALQTAGG